MGTYVHLWKYLAEFFLEGDMFQTIFVGKMKIYFMSNNVFLIMPLTR